MDADKSSLARVKIKFPDQLWISGIFRKFPDVRMEIAHFLPYDLERSIGNSIIELMHYEIDIIIEAIRNHPSVFEFSVLEKEDNKTRVNVKTKDPFHLYAIIKCGVLIPDNFINQFNEETEYLKNNVLSSVFYNLTSELELDFSIFKNLVDVLKFFKKE